jgi:hypothetical protein
MSAVDQLERVAKLRLAAAVFASVLAFTLSACGAATDDEKPEALPQQALPATECLKGAGATVISVDDFGEMLIVVAEAPESSTRLVIAMTPEMYSIEQGEEIVLPAEASATLGAGATEEDKVIATECAESWESTVRHQSRQR